MYNNNLNIFKLLPQNLFFKSACYTFYKTKSFIYKLNWELFRSLTVSKQSVKAFNKLARWEINKLIACSVIILEHVKESTRAYR